MRVVNADEVDALLDFPSLIDALGEAFHGGVTAPPRHHHTIERAGANQTLLLMPAWTERLIGVKTVVVSPDNGSLSLPAVMGNYLLMDGKTGQPLAILDGARLTVWRTAAASALAARYLAPAKAKHHLIIGAGALAPFVARAHASVRQIEKVTVWNRTRAGAERVAERLRAEGTNAEATDDLDGAISAADIISAATLSTEPLIKGARLKPGTHVDLIGAFTPKMRESDDECMQRATIFVDTFEGALKEAGDIVQPMAAGIIGREDIKADLAMLVSGGHSGRQDDDEITLFKSTGASLEDLAAATLVADRLGLS